MIADLSDEPTKQKPKAVRLLIAGGLFVLLVLIALFVRDQWVRPYGGDVLVVMFLHFLVRGLMPLGRWTASALVFLFAVAVEISQLIGLITLLGLESNAVANVVLGATFSTEDIVAYAAGAVFALALDREEV